MNDNMWRPIVKERHKLQALINELYRLGVLKKESMDRMDEEIRAYMDIFDREFEKEWLKLNRGNK